MREHELPDLFEFEKKILELKNTKIFCETIIYSDGLETSSSSLNHYYNYGLTHNM